MFNIVILGLTSFCTDIASEMVYPLVPFFLTSTLHAGPAALGVIEGIAESIASFLKVFSGYMSDRAGRRKGLTILGYTASVLGRVILIFAAGWGMVLGARVVDRFGKGIRTAPRDALIAESAPHGARGRAFGIHRGMDTAGAVIGVLLAYAIISEGSRTYATVFLWSLLPAGIGVVVLFWIRETGRASRAMSVLPTPHWKLLPRRLRLFLLVTLVFALGNSSNTFLLLRSAPPGGEPERVLLLYLAYNISYMLSSYPAGRLSDRIGRRPILALGYAVYGLVYAGFAVAEPGGMSWVPWFLFVCYGLYSGLTEGIEKALVADLAPTELRATAIGVHATLLGIGLLPASIMAGVLWEHLGPASPFFLGSFLGFSSAVGILLVLKT